MTYALQKQIKRTTLNIKGTNRNTKLYTSRDNTRVENNRNHTISYWQIKEKAPTWNTISTVKRRGPPVPVGSSFLKVYLSNQGNISLRSQESTLRDGRWYPHIRFIIGQYILSWYKLTKSFYKIGIKVNKRCSPTLFTYLPGLETENQRTEKI